MRDSNPLAGERFGQGDSRDSARGRLSNGAKTGAVAAPDAELAWLVEVWGSLPEDVRADILTTVAAALPATVAGPS